MNFHAVVRLEELSLSVVPSCLSLYELQLHLNSHTLTINTVYASTHTHLELIHRMPEYVHMPNTYA